MKANKLSWILKLSVAGALFGQLVMGAGLAPEMVTLINSLKIAETRTGVAGAEAAFAENFAGASKTWTAGFKILAARVVAKEIDVNAFRAFAEANSLTPNVTLSGISELSKKGKAITLKSLSETTSIASYVKSLSNKQAQTAVVGLPKQQATGIQLAAAGATGFVATYLGAGWLFKGGAAERFAKISNCDTSACILEKTEIGEVVAAALEARLLMKDVAGGVEMVDEALTDWYEGIYLGMLAGGQDAKSGVKWMADDLFRKHLGVAALAAYDGMRNIAKAAKLEGALVYLGKRPELKLCLQGRSQDAASTVAPTLAP